MLGGCSCYPWGNDFAFNIDLAGGNVHHLATPGNSVRGER